jgi:hypothetical protein
MLTRLALQTDIGSQPYDFPIISAAGMRLAQTDDVANLKVNRHAIFSGSDYTPGYGRFEIGHWRLT